MMCEEKITARVWSAVISSSWRRNWRLRDGIEAGERLIQHQQFGAMAEREQQGNLLPLTARQGRDAAVERHLPFLRESGDQLMVPALVERGVERDLLGTGEQ